jgi:hypothetical protein
MKSNSFLKIFIAFLILLQGTQTNDRNEMSRPNGFTGTYSSVMGSGAIEMYGAKPPQRYHPLGSKKGQFGMTI